MSRGEDLRGGTREGGRELEELRRKRVGLGSDETTSPETLLTGKDKGFLRR